MKQSAKTVAVWVLVLLLLVIAYAVLHASGDDGLPREHRVTLETDLDRGLVAWAGVDERGQLVVRRVDGTEYATDVIYTDEIRDELASQDVPVGFYESHESSNSEDPLGTVAGYLLLAIVVLVGVILLLRWLRRKQSGGLMAMKSSTARLLEQRPETKWSDVGGLKEAKAELQAFVKVLKNPDVYRKAGAKPIRGVLMEGPPGYGKTLLAKALASEAGVPFFEVSATEFVELFVGVGASRIRDLFESAKKKSPAVIFIDEIDALGRKRGGASVLTNHQEREQALNQLLVSMDGFADRDGVMVLAATNRAEILDPALLRPGRFDRVLRVAEYSADDRHEVLSIHMRSRQLDNGTDLHEIAELGKGLSGAELENACNAAATIAATRAVEQSAAPSIRRDDLEEAIRAQRPKEENVDQLDLVLAEATSGLNHPAQEMHVDVMLDGGEKMNGLLIWVDPQWLKIVDDEGAKVISRARIKWISSDDARATTRSAHLSAPKQTSPDTA